MRFSLGLAAAVVSLFLCVGCVRAQAAIYVDPDLPDSGSPEDLGDLYVVEEDGSWFCPKTDPHTFLTCPSPDTSAEAVNSLVSYINQTGANGKPAMLRVGKARNDCHAGDVGTACRTGVPTAPDPISCPNGVETSPFCALVGLKWNGVALGVIMGSGANNADLPKDRCPTDDPFGDDCTPLDESGRPTRDMAWQACQIKKADTYDLYDFIFLDEAKYLNNRVDDVVEHIAKGEIRQGDSWVKCSADHSHWTVITNDNSADDTYRYPQFGANTFDSLAWGHAHQLGVMKNQASADDAVTWQANQNQYAGPAITSDDRNFISEVEDGAQPDSHAILRLEVPAKTTSFARWLDPSDQNLLMTRWAAHQDDAGYPFTFVYPIYVHGGVKASNNTPYDSFQLGTFQHEMNLMGGY